MAMQSSILAWKIPWREEPGRRSQWGHKESDMTEQLSTHTCPSNILDLSLSSLLPFFFFFFFFGHAVRPHWVLVPQPGIKPTPHALEAQSLNHWTTWEAPSPVSFYSLLTLSAQLLNIQCISKCDQNFLSLLLKVPNSATDVPKG